MDPMLIYKAIAIYYNTKTDEITASLYFEAHMSLKSEGFPSNSPEPGFLTITVSSSMSKD
jgi:hypothetical protein